MEEISEKLCKQDAVVCVNCGSIYVEAKWPERICPGCSKPTLRWITTAHDWIDSIKLFIRGR